MWMTVMMCCTCGTSTSFLNCLEHERLSLHTTGTTTLSKCSTWGISTESAQFALCVPAVLSARTAGASRCMKQRRQPPSKNCNSGNSTGFCTVWTNLTCQAQQRACQHLLVQERPLDQRTCRCTQRANKLSKNCTCGIATEQREGHRHQKILRNCPPGAYRP